MKRHYAIFAGLVVIISLVTANDSLTVALQFDRVAIVDHWQLWRLVTCHMTHWSGDHWFWDITAFLVAGLAMLRISPKRLWALLAFSFWFISLWILFFNLEVLLCRGLSGVDMAMFVFLALSLARRFAQEKQWPRMAAAILLLLALTAKLAYEHFSGDMLFVCGEGKGTLLISAHIAGILSGVICFLLRKSDNNLEKGDSK
ncbi:MAG: rhombosortase [Victivallales bacterium]|nr:rhombosortase [Victivallales bacterium]